MLFDLTEEQVEFRDAVTSLMRRRVSAAAVRAAWADPEQLSADLWSELAPLGVLGLVVPEELGGAGASHVEQVVALEQLGYASAPGPVGESAVVAAVLVRHAAAAIQRQWLPRLAKGTVTLSVSLDDSGLVVHGRRCDAVLVARDETLHLVPGDRTVWADAPSQDPTRCLARGRFDLDESTLLTGEPEALQYARSAAYAGGAAQLVGCAQALLDMAVTYAMQREQFGQLIGSFQAIKHKLADAAVAIEAARSLSWAAGYALSHRLDEAPSVCRAAKAAASSAGSLANTTALQVHGGIGFTWEHDLHMWLKRSVALELSHGSPSEHREALGAALVDIRR